MRVGELVGLDREHLLHDTKGAVVKHGKGGKERTVLFSHPAWRAIQAYLSERRDEFRYRSVGPLPVFSRHDRRAGTRVLRLSTRAVQNVLWKLASQAEILEKFHLTPHSLRHFFATEFRKRTGDLALTQRALGHASPVTTDIYSKADDEEYKEAYRDAFGSGRPSDP
jgi:integrase/recombinase XerD